jgi:hypothetical protein
MVTIPNLLWKNYHETKICQYVDETFPCQIFTFLYNGTKIGFFKYIKPEEKARQRIDQLLKMASVKARRTL